MANWISGEDDMLLDFERIDAENKGLITPSVVDTINRLGNRGLNAEWIAKQLCLDISKVEEVLTACNGKA